jgi:hypothetical protein
VQRQRHHRPELASEWTVEGAGRVSEGAEHAAHGDRQVLQGLQPVPQAGAGIDGAGGSQVEASALLGAQQARADVRYAVVDAARGVQPVPGRLVEVLLTAARLRQIVPGPLE